MTIKPKKQLQERKTIEPWIIDFLIHGRADNSEVAEVLIFQFSHNYKLQKKVWNDAKVEILKQFIKDYPCQRPWGWWEYEALKEPVNKWIHGRFDSAQRKRLGGIGTPDFEVLAYAPSFEFGLPMGYVNQWQVDYYNGRSKDIHGNPIGTEYKDGDFKGVAVDPDDPPTFESQASYLDRHGLLSQVEKIYLKKHPELLEPEKGEFHG